jgi:hypothetical protein
MRLEQCQKRAKLMHILLLDHLEEQTVPRSEAFRFREVCRRGHGRYDVRFPVFRGPGLDPADSRWRLLLDSDVGRKEKWKNPLTNPFDFDENEMPWFPLVKEALGNDVRLMFSGYSIGNLRFVVSGVIFLYFYAQICFVRS